jgi:hypothetical protein
LNQHLSDEDLQSFIKRTAAPPSLVRIDRHLSACDECRRRLESLSGADARYQSLRHALEQDAPSDHLSYEEVRASAEGRPSSAAARHLDACRACTAEADDLRACIAGQPLQPAAAPASPRRVWRWAIAAAVAIALIPLAWRISRRAGQEQYAIVLRDAGGLVALDSVGELHTPSKFPQAYAAALKSALETRRLAVPEQWRQSGAAPEVLLGARERSSRFALLHPAGEAMLTSQPRFAWEPLQGADGYRVTVYDRSFRKVLESPGISATEWTPPEGLAAGQTYTWVVTARVGGRAIRAPVPPAAEARFTVLLSEDAARLEQARSRYPDAHLMLAALFAQAGALAETRQELDALARANPGSALVREIASSPPAPRAHEPSPSSTKPAQ